MTIPEKEQEALELLENHIEVSIPELSELERYRFGYEVLNDHITGISLFSCGLSTIPKIIESFSSLNEIYLRGNNLDSIPDELCSLPVLEILDLSENQLKELPDLIRSLSKLRELHLESNQLNNLPASFGDLISLELLDLSENQLGNIPTSLGKLNKLKTLDLSRNEITNLPDSLGALISLEVFY